MEIKEKDFIEIDYTGRIKEDNIIFDTTDEKTAKQSNIYNEQMQYRPIVICIGQGQLIKGIDHQLIGKETGKEYIIDIKPEQGFGKKSAKLLKMVPMSIFKKQSIQPMPGLQVNMDGLVGTIRTVAGGRTIVDFNHPLAGKDLTYTVKINKLVTDTAQKIESFMLIEFGFKPDKIEIKDSDAMIIIKKTNFNIIKDSKDKISSKLTELIDSIKTVKFEELPETQDPKQSAKPKNELKAKDKN